MPQPITRTLSASLGDQPIKINIATPAYGSTYDSVYVKTLYLLLTNKPANIQFSFSEIDCADIVTARNFLISNFYFNHLDCTHLLFIDSDMGFSPRLLQHMLAIKQDLVGIIAPKRKLDVQKLHQSSPQLPFSQAYAQACTFIGAAKDKNAQADFVEVTECGAGIMLISRQCIDIMIKKCPEIVDHQRFKNGGFATEFKQFLTPFNTIDLVDRSLSEDFSFCYRWHNLCGGKIFANTTAYIEHVGRLHVKTRCSDLTP